MDTNKIPYMKNIQTIYFENERIRQGKQYFKKSVIESVGYTLSSQLVDYIKKGGDINNLTPDDLFKPNN